MIMRLLGAKLGLSSALDSGKHTTTYAKLYALDGGGALIDSPGLQEFGLAQLDVNDLDVENLAYFKHCAKRLRGPSCSSRPRRPSAK